MSGKESAISYRVLVEMSKRGAFMMRNNRGKFRTLDGLRIVEAGLSVNGSSDLIGWHSVEVTADMIGKRVAIFTAVEVKTPTGAIRPEQQRFIDNLNAAGGKGIFARSEKDVDSIL